MCDPFSLAVASTVIGGAGTLAGSIGERNAQKKQQDAVAVWRQRQQKFRDAETQRQEKLRQEADVARTGALKDVSAEGQQARQDTEAARLTEQFTSGPGADVSVADAALTGQSNPGVTGDDFQTDLAKKLSEASAAAKKRIGALATLQSYGGSAGGLGTMNPILMGNASDAIDVANNKRRGSLSAFNVEAAEEPLQVTYQPGIFETVAPTLLSLGTSGLGASMAGAAGGAAGGLGAGTAAQIVDPWAGLRFPSTPATMQAPKFNMF